jgi:hypothetical protein
VVLPKRVAEVLLLEAEVNDLGRIEYRKTLEEPFEIFVEANETRPLQFPLTKPRIHIHGMVQDDFMVTLGMKLEEYETSSKTGTIQRASIRNALKEQVNIKKKNCIICTIYFLTFVIRGYYFICKELGLTTREANFIVGYIEKNYPSGDLGDYYEVSSRLFLALCKLFDRNMLGLPTDKAMSFRRLMDLFTIVDKNKTCVDCACWDYK